MRKHLLTTGLLLTVLALLVLAGRHAAADAPNVNAKPSPDLRVNGDIYDQMRDGFTSGKVSEWRTKIAAGSNATATVTIDLITDGGAGNQTDDGVTSGTVSGQGTKIAVEVFARGVTTPLIGVKIEFDFKAEELKLDKVENSAFLFALPEPTGINFAATAPVTLPSSGFIGRAEFSTVADVTGREFTLGIKRVTLAESAASSDVVTTTDVISFNANFASSPAASSSDFDGDGMVGTADFLLFAYHFGSSLGDGTYQAKYDLDGNGVIGLSDVLIFVDNFGSQVSPSGGGGGGSSSGGAIVTIPDANLRAVIADSLGKARNASITRAEMATLTRIDAPNKGIRSLTGLEHATNLQWLGLGSVRVNNEWVNSNDISNLSPLSNLTNLTVLGLGGNSISDISSLSNLTNLTRLDLWDNSISDISALSNLTNLTYLDLTSNSISDISALSNLTNLTVLGLGDNSISDISSLSNLTNLTGLGLWENSISDISSLSNLTNLTVLGLGDNSISDISALSNLTNLTGLFLSGNSISDISPLVANTGLGSGDTVDLKSNPLSSASINTHIPALQRRGVTVEFDSSSGSGGSGGSSPDLIVGSPSVSDNTLTTGQSFTLSATVRNQGTGSSAATTLRYYRSSNSTISTSDTEIGTDTVNGLSASGTSAESISLNAPSSAGTYYYGACVESVSGESDTGNNCSDAVRVTVATVTPPATGTAKLYWTDWGTGKIQRADLDGSNVEDLVSGTGLNGPDGLALDLSGGKMYWTNVGTNKIQRADLDGSNVEDLVTSGLSVPYGLALDLSGGKMYWSNRQTSKIQRADLDGSNVEDLLTLSGLAFPGELALDVSGGKMYWTNPGMDKIQRANLDGSNVEDLVASGLNSPTGLALDVSGGKIYWTDRGTHKVQRADLDGSNVEDLITSGLNTPTGLDLDVSGGKMYWTDVDADKVQRANLDGSNVEDLLTRSDGLVDPSGLAVGVIGTGSSAITGSITDCSATVDGSIYRIRITGTVQAIRPVSSLTLQGYVGSSFVGMVSLGSMSAGQTKSFTITGISDTEPSGGCRVNMEWREGGGKSQGVVNER